jgi:hypothetical protein
MNDTGNIKQTFVPTPIDAHHPPAEIPVGTGRRTPFRSTMQCHFERRFAIWFGQVPSSFEWIDPPCSIRLSGLLYLRTPVVSRNESTSKCYPNQIYDSFQTVRRGTARPPVARDRVMNRQPDATEHKCWIGPSAYRAVSAFRSSASRRRKNHTMMNRAFGAGLGSAVLFILGPAIDGCRLLSNCRVLPSLRPNWETMSHS